jgi:hypothetical protein
MSPGKVIAFISLAVVLVLLFLLFRRYRRRSTGHSLSDGVRIWSKTDRWRPWR